MNPFNPVSVAHRFVRSVIQSGDLCIDATVGNGHDTCFLCELVGDKGHVLGFDVQSSALQSAQASLVDRRLEGRVTLLNQGHETLGIELAQRALPDLKLVMFNLGYLPGSDKSVVTQTESTLEALNQSLDLLAPAGALSVIAYRGHEGGHDESLAVELWVKDLPASSYFCARYERWSKRRGLTPVFFWVRKLDNGIA